MDFWENFRALCKEKKVSQRAACTAIGVSPSMSAKAAKDGTKPSFDVLIGASEYFNVTLDELVFPEKYRHREDDGNGVDSLLDLSKLSADQVNVIQSVLRLSPKELRAFRAFVETLASAEQTPGV